MKLINTKTPPSFKNTIFQLELNGEEAAAIAKCLGAKDTSEGNRFFNAFYSAIPEACRQRDHLDHNWRLPS